MTKPHFATCDFPASLGDSRTTGFRVRELCLGGGAIAYGIVSSLGIVGSIVGTCVMSFTSGVVTFAGGGSFRVGGSMMGCGGDIRHVGFSFGGATRSYRVGVDVNIGGSGGRGVVVVDVIGVMSTAMFV